MKTLQNLLSEQPFFSGFEAHDLDLIAGCATNVRFEAGQFICREGEEANQFYLLRQGKVAVEFFAPERGAISIQTLDEGDVLGWSWLVPPHEARFDARALTVTRAIALDGKCLRTKCEQDPRLGFAFLMQVAKVIEDRLQATRLQLLDLYGPHK
ncbi:MAG: cyclic nucleotide-binding domain-containing protein [bacterium]